jgi:hypothetical protein
VFLLDDNNNLVDSEFSLDVLEGSPCLIVESSGGSVPARNVPRRNPEYRKLLGLLLTRLAKADARITAVILDSSRVSEIAICDRIAALDRPYPIDLSALDIDEFRRSLGRAISWMHRAPGATTSGNAQKRIRISLDRPVEPGQLLTANADAEIAERISADHAPGLTETEREYIQKARVGQGQFRKYLLEAYRSTCPIVGISNAELLVASHIKPWNVCTNEERLDRHNGILLSALFDRLFDRGLITFDNDGAILASPCLAPDDRVRSGLDQAARLELSPKSRGFMEYHRNCVFKHIGPDT